MSRDPIGYNAILMKTLEPRELCDPAFDIIEQGIFLRYTIACVCVCKRARDEVLINRFTITTITIRVLSR